MSRPISTNLPVEPQRPVRSAAVNSPLTGLERETSTLPADQTIIGSRTAESSSLTDIATKARKALIETTLAQVDAPEVTLHNYARYGGGGEMEIRELNRKATDSYNKALAMVTTSDEALMVAFQAVRFKRPEMAVFACNKALDLAATRIELRNIALFGNAYGYPELTLTADSRAASYPRP